MSRRRTAEPRPGYRAARQRGVGLVEVLIATLLVSIGLLTLASLQMLSLSRGTSSALRTEALFQSYDLLDRMRANRAQAIGGLYDLPFETDPGSGSLATDDLGAWKAALDATLPNGDGQVRVEAQVVTIQVRWRDAGSGAEDPPAVISLRSQL